MEIENLKNQINLKGATPLIKTDIDDDKSYENLLKTQYEFILKEEIKIIKDIKIAENSCKIMGFKPGFTKKNKKKFNKCVLEVWQARLIGKKFVSMQSEIDTRNFTAEELQTYFNKKLDAFNEVRNKQLKKNESFKKKFEQLGVKDKLSEVDYQKIVVYAIGIVVVYYIGKTMMDSLEEAKISKDVAQSGSTTVSRAANSKNIEYVSRRNITYCNYGKMLLARYGYRHGALRFCSR